jgi:putative ABC transport system permease protein
VDGVKSVTRLSTSSVHLEGSTGTVNDKTVTSFDANATDSETVAEGFNFHTDPAFTDINGGVFIGSDLQALGIKVGDTVTLKGDASSQELKVTGLYKDDDTGGFFMDWGTATELFTEVPIQQGLVVLDDGADIDATQTAIEDALKDEYPLIVLQQPGQLVQLVNTIINMILGFISALLLTALLIALLGVANTLLLSVTERTREIGLLRAVGLKRSSIWRMITIESMVMALFGTVLGMILGVGLGSALVLSLKDQGFDGVAIPWVLLAVYTVLAAIAGVLAAIWPAWRASRLDILQAIAADG